MSLAEKVRCPLQSRQAEVRPATALRGGAFRHRGGRRGRASRDGQAEGRGGRGGSPRVSFYGTKCQDGSPRLADRPLQRRRPLPVGACGGACPGSAGSCNEPCALPGRPRVRSWRRNRSPLRMTVALPRSALDGILDEIEALVFSRREREPSFYQGLFWPWLLSVLRGGIAYPRDLRSTAPVPGNA